MRVVQGGRILAIAAACAIVSACGGTPAVTEPPTSTAAPTLPIHYPAWSGAPGYAQLAFLLYGDFGCAEVVKQPYDPGITNPIKLYLTYDGGDSWVDRTPPTDVATGFLYMGLHFADPFNAWFIENVYATYPEVKEHLLYRTSDGGKTWTTHVIPIPSAYIASDLDMADGVHGLVGTLGDDQTSKLWGTSDGGSTWTKLIDVPYDPNGNFPPQPTMVSATEGWSMGYADLGLTKLLHSTDGGRSWQSNGELPMPEGTQSIYGVDGAPSWAHRASAIPGADFSISGWVSDGTTWRYVIWASRDHGATWAIESATTMTSQSTMPVYLGAFYTGLQISGNSVEYFDTRTLGATAVFDPSIACRDGLTGSVDFMRTPEEVWVRCTHPAGGFTDYSYLYRTRDGGKTWSPMMGAP
jgi:hypothetical protein